MKKLFCKKCSEPVEPNFDVCWKCNTSYKDIENWSKEYDVSTHSNKRSKLTTLQSNKFKNLKSFSTFLKFLIIFNGVSSLISIIIIGFFSMEFTPFIFSAFGIFGGFIGSFIILGGMRLMIDAILELKNKVYDNDSLV